MNIIDKFINEFRYTFEFFKQRSKNKFYGDRFEEWIVQNSNITKINQKGKIDYNYWKLIEWRGDKYINGYFPESSLGPDLILKCNAENGFPYSHGDHIAIECKWRNNKENFFLENKSICKYEDYLSNSNSHIKISRFFYVFGFGWKDNKPKSLYVIPSFVLYEYDPQTRSLTNKSMNFTKDIELLNKYRIDLNKRGYLIYYKHPL